MKNPWMKFYPSDWRSHTNLRLCGAGARGLWIEMICIMHEADKYGFLMVNGHALNPRQLAMQTGIPVEEVTEYLDELEQSGVFSRDQSGTIYSRKMVRDARKSETARKNGKSGGNPSLSKQKTKSASDNQTSTGEDKPQKPEARSQKLDKEDTDVSSKSDGDTPPRPIPVNDHSEAVSIYNEAAERVGWPRVQKLTKARAAALKGRLEESGGIEGWRYAVEAAEKSDFLSGRNGKWTGCTFDWISKQGNFIKVMEGNYDDKPEQQTGQGGSGGRRLSHRDRMQRIISSAARGSTG